MLLKAVISTALTLEIISRSVSDTIRALQSSLSEQNALIGLEHTMQLHVIKYTIHPLTKSMFMLKKFWE